MRLAAFNLPSIAKLTMTDELHLQELGERKIALFCCIPDSDKSLNYLVGMIYTQLIQTLYRQADRIHKGRLPVPVHCLMDEYSLPFQDFGDSTQCFLLRIRLSCSHPAVKALLADWRIHRTAFENGRITSSDYLEWMLQWPPTLSAPDD